MDVKTPDEGRYRFGPFILNPAQRELLRDGVPVALTYRLFETLLVFVRNPGRTLSKDELLEAIWPGRYMEESSLKQAIFTLRKTLGGDDDKPYIVTAPARGYSFIVPVERITASAPIPWAEATSPRSDPTAFERAHVTTTAVPKKSFVPPLLVALALAIVLASTASIYWRSRTSPAAARPKTVVVADFQNLSGDPVLGTVLGKVLQIDLSQSPHLNLLTEQQIGETLQQMERPRDAPLTAQLAQEVCVRNRSDAVLSGSVAKTGAQYFVTLEAKDCTHGAIIVAARTNLVREEDVPAALDDLAVKARQGLQESSESIHAYEMPITQATTASFAALKAYSLGEQLRTRGDNANALQFFKHAIELDPSFALAYAELGNCYFGLREMEMAKAVYKKAFDLRDRMTEKERLGVTANYYSRVGNFVEAERAFRVSTETYPEYWAPWANLANFLTNMARYDDAIIAGRQALRLNPDHSGPYVVLARAYKRANRFAEARATAQLAVHKGLDNWDLHGILYEIAYAEGDKQTMAAEVAKEKGQTTQAYMLDYQALAAATSGRLKDAQALWSQAIALARSQGPDSVEDVANFYCDEIENTRVLASQQAAAKIAATASAAETAQFEAFAFAGIGDYQRATAMTEAAAAKNPDSTQARDIDLPLTRAQIDLDQNKPADVIPALQPDLPYELRDFWAPYLLGRAYLETGAAAKAATEFRKILANRGVDGLSPLYPLAWLNLARALHAQHEDAESRADYQRFLTFWKTADGDLPMLLQARMEYSRL